MRRVSTVMGLLRGLEVTETLRAAQLALLFVAASTGPDAEKRVLLSDEDRAALDNISKAAAELS